MSEWDNESEFAETEEKPRPSPWRYGWLLGAMVLGLAGWQWSEAIVRPAGVTAISSSLEPPPQLHSQDRSSADRASANVKDPVARYLAAAGRGMTEREIRWMLEDFQQLGLDQLEIPQPTNAYQRNLGKWYLLALNDGLSLTAAQKDQAAARLVGLKAPADVTKLRFAPWNVCDLRADQQSLVTRLRGAAALSTTWLHPTPSAITDPGSNVFVEIGKQAFPGRLLPITDAFPLIAEQKLDQPTENPFDEARHCHPAQLRMALLMNPRMHRTLTQRLEETQAIEQALKNFRNDTSVDFGAVMSAQELYGLPASDPQPPAPDPFGPAVQPPHPEEAK